MNAPACYRALIAEDEPVLAAVLTQALQRLWPQLRIVATCANGVEAVQRGLTQLPDIMFLDIKMPGQSGLEAAAELAERWPDGRLFPSIVFVTAYDEFALAAFDHAAVDYVLKPVSDSRLGKTVERLRQRLATPAAPGHEQLATLLAQWQALAPPGVPAQRLHLIRAAVGNQVRMIALADVLYFEALDKYVNVVTMEGEALIRTSLKELLPQLDPQQFWQVHRGTIVNAACIASAVRDETGKLTLNLRGRAQQLRVSPLYAHLFRQM